MLIIAWIMAPLCAFPQIFIFQVKTHPLKSDYSQSTTFGYFKSEALVQELQC